LRTETDSQYRHAILLGGRAQQLTLGLQPRRRVVGVRQHPAAQQDQCGVAVDCGRDRLAGPAADHDRNEVAVLEPAEQAAWSAVGVVLDDQHGRRHGRQR
jgi:hypothetical protein